MVNIDLHCKNLTTYILMNFKLGMGVFVHQLPQDFVDECKEDDIISAFDKHFKGKFKYSRVGWTLYSNVVLV